jgi:hypothetical protein
LGGEVPLALTNLTNLSFANLGYNLLTASNPAVAAFLNAVDYDWAATQTVPPAHLQALQNGGSIELSWTPIAYTGDGGYYEISYATAPGGPYTVYGVTGDKFAGSFTLSGLPAGVYYLRLRAYTPAHGAQQNDLWSEYTLPVRVGVLVYLPLVARVAGP